MNRRLLLIVLAFGLTGCAESILRVDPATVPRRWASDPRTQHWQRPLSITYTFWASGRVTADVSPAHQWWRHIGSTGWVIHETGAAGNFWMIDFDGVTECYLWHWDTRVDKRGEAILTVIPPGANKPRTPSK